MTSEATTALIENEKQRRECHRRANGAWQMLIAASRVEDEEMLAELDIVRIAEYVEQLRTRKEEMRQLRKQRSELVAARTG